jgi:hypothetical protein
MTRVAIRLAAISHDCFSGITDRWAGALLALANVLMSKRRPTFPKYSVGPARLLI